ncbi:hypothetical protein PF005_g24218 [Phytophthora fragariae]|uniref:Uncharacterized protein n=1 Tax=Phytophthora fragariae TaxID=53985 RepID=A0A6A3DUK6_9STRA|nr:hypothetical protein PF003_g31663 [Phytophthora fragariae]KAE8924755.1 hypothetical protein PF009_g25021 [Phytophthora fragariae]KAE8965232.1 hypothetical protein PF011_g28374 [Phytophthora fragariae]KAE9076779.1 hypothetical protein PF006_g28054 [Phytophthora fragariae]KAE9077476.1 hypothetical protein PF007_g24232 [Phytophthora fragariae]
MHRVRMPRALNRPLSGSVALLLWRLSPSLPSSLTRDARVLRRPSSRTMCTTAPYRLRCKQRLSASAASRGAPFSIFLHDTLHLELFGSERANEAKVPVANRSELETKSCQILS